MEDLLTQDLPALDLLRLLIEIFVLTPRVLDNLPVPTAVADLLSDLQEEVMQAQVHARLSVLEDLDLLLTAQDLLFGRPCPRALTRCLKQISGPTIKPAASLLLSKTSRI